MSWHFSENPDFSIDISAKKIFSPEFKDIIEVTYAYSDIWYGRYLNRTLFCWLIHEDITQNETQDRVIERYRKAEKIILEKIEEIRNLKKQVWV